MQITYDSISEDYVYPLSKRDVASIKDIIGSNVIDKIIRIKFGCNTKTTQEGRLVQRGNRYEIRINFCLSNARSRVLSDTKKYLKQISAFGGLVDLNTRSVSWDLHDAKRYALFLLLHEIGHIIYSGEQGRMHLGWDSSTSEEQWCDDFAFSALENLARTKSGGALQ